MGNIKNIGKYEEKFWYWLVKKLPKKLLYFSFMQVTVEATTGKYSDTIVPEITAMDVIKRYGDDNGI